MDPDISIWQKTGHFYFALTGLNFGVSPDNANSNSLRSAIGLRLCTVFFSLLLVVRPNLLIYIVPRVNLVWT